MKGLLLLISAFLGNALRIAKIPSDPEMNSDPEISGMPAFLLSLPQEKECAEKTQNVLTKFGFDVIHHKGAFLPAFKDVSGALQYDKLASHVDMSEAAVHNVIDHLKRDSANDNGEGVAGVALAHASIWSKIVNSNIDHALIIEKDASIWGLSEMEFNAMWNKRPKDGVIFQFGTQIWKEQGKETMCCNPAVNSNCDEWKPGGKFSNTAYVVTRNAADQLLSLVSNNLLKQPVDLLWDKVEGKTYHLEMMPSKPSFARRGTTSFDKVTPTALKLAKDPKWAYVVEQCGAITQDTTCTSVHDKADA